LGTGSPKWKPALVPKEGSMGAQLRERWGIAAGHGWWAMTPPYINAKRTNILFKSLSNVLTPNSYSVY
jgi:hypothetical protein